MWSPLQMPLNWVPSFLSLAIKPPFCNQSYHFGEKSNYIFLLPTALQWINLALKVGLRLYYDKCCQSLNVWPQHPVFHLQRETQGSPSTLGYFLPLHDHLMAPYSFLEVNTSLIFLFHPSVDVFRYAWKGAFLERSQGRCCWTTTACVLQLFGQGVDLE